MGGLTADPRAVCREGHGPLVVLDAAHEDVTLSVSGAGQSCRGLGDVLGRSGEGGVLLLPLLGPGGGGVRSIVGHGVNLTPTSAGRVALREVERGADGGAHLGVLAGIRRGAARRPQTSGCPLP